MNTWSVGENIARKDVAISTIYTVLYPTFTHDDPSAFNIIRIVNCIIYRLVIIYIIIPILKIRKWNLTHIK